MPPTIIKPPDQQIFIKACNDISMEQLFPPAKRLVLDAGGVLFGEKFRPFLRELAREGGADEEKVLEIYDTQLRKALWQGNFSVDEFWLRLGVAIGVPLDRKTVEKRLYTRLRPLKTFDYLERWQKDAELWILSNHRHEWLRPQLKQYASDISFDRLIISSEVGRMKPDIGIYEDVTGGTEVEVLFVDDKQENLDTAERLGIKTILADDEGSWQEKVDDWLAS